MKHLAKNQIAIYLKHLEKDNNDQQRSILSHTETQRADRFHFEKDRYKFIDSHTTLRELLCEYLSLDDPREIIFQQNEFGKPAIAQTQNPENLYFNMSHSGDYAVYAISPDAELGVDIESIRRNVQFDELINRFFSPAEQAEFKLLEDKEKALGFFNAWTRKEAFIKAVGTGLSYPLDEFDVNLTPGVEARLLSIKGNKKDADQWSLHSFNPAAGYVCALAIKQPAIQIVKPILYS